MDVLITGSEGFVGRYFKDNFDGHNVTGIDIKTGTDCRDFFKKEDKSYDLVIHLAAIVGGRESIEGRPMAVADNLSIDSEFFQWCLKTNPKKIVYFSSSAAYYTHLQTDKQKDFLGNIEQAREQIGREPYNLPTLNINTEHWPRESEEGPIDAIKVFDSFTDDAINLGVSNCFVDSKEISLMRNRPLSLVVSILLENIEFISDVLN